MKQELIPMAEDKSNFGKIVKRAIRCVRGHILPTALRTTLVIKENNLRQEVHL